MLASQLRFLPQLDRKQPVWKFDHFCNHPGRKQHNDNLKNHHRSRFADVPVVFVLVFIFICYRLVFIYHELVAI
ncbi:hypothetical protein KC332_g4311, partial [Hortaea werneckii]